MVRAFVRKIVSTAVAAAVLATPVALGSSAAEAAVSRRPVQAEAKVSMATTSAYTQAYTQQLAGSGAWCWFGDPRAVYHKGQYSKTYVGWIDRNNNIVVASHDQVTKRRTTAVLMHKFQRDDHDNPSLLIRPDGHIVVFWSEHAGDDMFYRISTRPEDVTSWSPVMTVKTNVAGSMGYTYPNPVQLSDEGNKIYLFWRGGNFNPTFSTSLDGANTWTPARNLISAPGQRPYMKVDSDGKGTIHFAFTDGHPRDQHNSVYYMAYRGGSFYKADGTRIGGLADLPFKPSETDRVYDARDSGTPKAWTHDVAFDADGKPVITFATFPTDTDHRYHYARWTGDKWLDVELTNAGGTISGDPAEPNYSGGITLDHEDPRIVYMSRPVKGVFEIERWTNADGKGIDWKVEAITSNSKWPNYRPISPRGQTGGDLDIIWMSGQYPSYANFHTLMKRTGAGPTANPAPVSMFEPASRNWTAVKGNTVKFSTAGSGDSNGYIKSYQWNFGDGTTATGSAPVKRFGAPGRYWVRLLVTDNGNGRDERVHELIVNRAPSTALTIGSKPGTIRLGQTTTISGKLTRTDNGRPVAGQVVEVYGRPVGSTVWTLLAKPKTNAAGMISYSRKPAGTVEFTLRHRGSASTMASASGDIKVHMVK
jgi:hypothetical protein